MEKMETSYTAGGNERSHGHTGNQFGGSSKC